MDYKVYQITKKEMFRYAAVYILADVLISLLFYRSVLAAVVFLPGICFFFREVRRELAKKRRKQLERGFLVGMRCVSTALTAGYSVENAFTQAYEELQKLYSEKGSSAIIRYYCYIPCTSTLLQATACHIFHTLYVLSFLICY